MTVYENIFVGNEIKKGFRVDWNETIKRATEALKRVKLNVNPAPWSKTSAWGSSN